MRILVTGGRGFIGRHVLEQLTNLGVDITAIRRPACSGNYDYQESRVQWLDCALDDTHNLRQIFSVTRPDVCMHLAWITKSGKYATSAENIKLVNSSLELLQISAESGCSRFVGVGTCAEYENAVGPLHEKSRTNPQTLYGASKLALRYMGENLAKQLGIQFAWGRVFYVYGPHENQKRVVPAVINTLLDGQIFQASSGEQIRDFMHVEDVASAFVKLCIREEQGVFNICSSEPKTLRSLLISIAALLNRPDAIRFGVHEKSAFDPPYVLGENTRLMTLGWKQRLGIEVGLEKTIQWWQENRQVETCHK